MFTLIFRYIPSACSLLALLLAASQVGYCQDPQKVTPCQLKNDPSTYNQRLVEVTGFVSHGFEDFGLFDPTCPSWPYIWLEYGGTVKSGTMYCCGVSSARSRSKQLVVENTSIPLVADDAFQKFDRLIQRTPDSVVHATILGRFFAGRRRQDSRGTSWGGYGHMGCCSLLVIQQVRSVDAHDRVDLDYRASPDQPRVDCGYRDLVPIEPYRDSLEAQKAAESGQRDWAFDDPLRVASESLARTLNIAEMLIQGIKRSSKAQGRFVYEWNAPGRRVSYTVVVSRPYWLSFYSADPKKVAWVVIAAYESPCGKRHAL